MFCSPCDFLFTSNEDRGSVVIVLWQNVAAWVYHHSCDGVCVGFSWFSNQSLFLGWSFFVLVIAPKRASIQEVDGLVW